MSIHTRNAVTIRGSGIKPMLFVHGYGCDQQIWRYIAPHFEDSHKVVLYDHVGSGRSDLSAYDKMRYATLQAYADDMIELCDELGLTGVDVLAHSVGCMITVLAAKKRPDLFDQMMLLGPSPCYIDDGDYVGGFNREGIEELLAFMAINQEGLAANLAPMVMRNEDRPELAAELEAFFCRNDPDIFHHFAGVLFFSDHRADITGFEHPCLIMQCQDDIVAPVEVGLFMHDVMPGSELMVLDTFGHYPQLSSPDVVTHAVSCYLSRARQLAA